MSTLISCRQINKTYGPQTLFADLDLNISEGERLGLIGANGAGKSTLLKILAELDTPDQGEVIRRNGLRMAYVPQIATFEAGHSIFSIVAASAQKANVPDPEAAAHIALGRAGFDDTDAEAVTLSGGRQKRLTLARALVTEPELMLLDEPTNHLDIESFLWLEDILARAPFAWAMITHDRMFLQRTATKVAELGPMYESNLFSIDGKYRDFIEKRDAWLDQRLRYRDALSNKVRRETEWLGRSPKARTTKSKSRVDEAHRLTAELDQVKSGLRQSKTRIDFTASERKTRKLIEVKALAKTRGQQNICSKLNLLLSPGKRLGILGGNGTGKTTILKMLMGDLAPDAGDIRFAPDLKLVYFDQNRSQLNPAHTLQRSLSETGDSVIYRGNSIHVISWAKRFRFTPDQLGLKVSELSGGEQARLLIARLMLREADVLLLDEPTNDLDIPTLEVLEEALMDFAGSVVLVTHDRFMIDRICNSFVGLDGKGGTGEFADYEQWERAFKSGSAPEKPRKTESNEKKPKAAPKKLSYKDQREWDGMEEAIMQAEEHLESCQAEVDDPKTATNAAKAMEAYDALNAAQAEVARLYERWAELEALQEGA